LLKKKSAHLNMFFHNSLAVGLEFSKPNKSDFKKGTWQRVEKK